MAKLFSSKSNEHYLDSEINAFRSSVSRLVIFLSSPTPLSTKNFTIPLSTLSTTHFSQSYDDTRRYHNRHSSLIVATNGGQPADIIAHDRSGGHPATTIEGASVTGDTSIGGCDLHFAITAHRTDTERAYESCSNRGGGGGGGGGGVVSVGCGGQSPPTPHGSVGKTLLNTSANLLPITTASDTFNNLKNLVKIDKGLTASSGNGYRSKGYNKSGGVGPHLGSPTSGERERNNSLSNGLLGGGRTGAVGASGHFSTGYNKNSVKIRQHDSDVSPRPRRSYQSDSSSSRYYSKNSDILGQQSGGSVNNGSGTLGNNSSGRSLIGEQSARSGRNYQHVPASSDGGYNSRSINNSASNSGGGGGYRQQQSSTRYENGIGNGNGQHRQYASGASGGGAGYNNNNNSSSNKSISSPSASVYATRGSFEGNVNARPSQRDDYGSNSTNYGRDYDDRDARPRYSSGGQQQPTNTNSLERTNGRYAKSSSDTGAGNGSAAHPPSALRQNQNAGYAHDAYDNRAQNNRTPPARGGNGLNSHSSTSRGISPNGPSAQQQQSPSGSATTTTIVQTTGRWVPPSLRPQHGLTQSEKNDAVFRRVRGILNKLTPEKFQELSDDLLKLDLNSIVILNGVILLIFDKALDEPKYSSMYAQLCKRLSEEAPSFEKDPNISCTFLRLLIAVCRDKFNNRLKRDTTENDNNNQFNKVHRPEANNAGETSDVADEEERRTLAKQRMLGNVKFIGELHKLDMLAKNVLHQCIMELLEKKKKRSATQQEMCEDMECLAQLLKTCGKNLDSEQGKELMNQYFEKLERRSKSTDYPPRIRFMLKDVIELRENRWIPRKVGTTDGPVPIKQIRTDDDSMMRTPFANRSRDMRNNDRDNDSWMNRFHLNLQPGYNDMFGSLGVSGQSPMSMSPFNNHSNRSYNNRDRNNQNNGYNNGGNNNNNNMSGNRYGSNKHNQNHNGNGGNRDDNRNHNQHSNRDRDQMMGSQYGGGNGGQMMMNNKELAPRFKRNLMATNQDAVENLQMRPAANSLLFKAASQNQKLPTMLPMCSPLQNSAAAAKEQLSSAQYPLLGTPTSHLSQPARPSSTPSAEYDNKVSGQHLSAANGVGLIAAEKGLKATSSSPNFGATLLGNNAGERASAGVEAVDSNPSDNGDQRVGAVSQTLITKQGSVEKAASANGAGAAKQPKKDKAFNKEEVLKRVSAFIKDKFFYEQEVLDASEDLEVTKENNAPADAENVEKEHTDDVIDAIVSNDKQLKELIEGFALLKVPEKCMKDVCLCVVMDVLDKAEDRFLERVIVVLQALRKQSNMKPNVMLEVFKQAINKMNEREALNPRIATHVASLLSKAVIQDEGLLKLTDIANYTDNGQHYPLFLLVLQQLHKAIGKEALEEKYRASKIDLMSSLPETDRNKTRLAEILDDRNLAFLYPLLKVHAEMLRQIMTDPNPSAFYKWIKANVDSKYFKDPGFVSALITVLLKFITQETSLAPNTDIKKHPEKPIIEREEGFLQKYCQILQNFLVGNTELQLIAIYSLQVFCFSENFPKGMLCRWFKYLYEAEVIEEESFVLWKEEISDKYPGKGSALFQVNNWLTWLQEAESEDDED